VTGRGVFAAVLVLASLVGSLSGCERTVKREDCDAIAASMHRVWTAEVQASVEKNKKDVPADRAKEVIKTEGEKMKAEWAAECKKEVMGRRADPKEIECLLKVKSFDEVAKCGEAR